MKQSWNGNHGACQLKRQKVGASSALERAGDSIVFDRKEDVCAAVPCCIKEPTPNQKLLRRVKLFSTTSDPGLQGWASYHSYGLNLRTRQEVGKLLLNLYRFNTSVRDLRKCKNIFFILLEHHSLLKNLKN